MIIAMVAGETSGDILGAGLIHALKLRNSSIRFIGVGGPRMKKEGCEIWYDMEELSLIGIVEVLKRLPRLLKIRRSLIERFLIIKPDVFIGIDAPDFNIGLEGRLKRKGIRTIHYVSPSIWAWRKKRIFKIARNTQLILLLLPFEKRFYDFWNIPCRFIGHAMADDIEFWPNKLAARWKLNIPDNALCLALFPGSRNTELKMLTESFLKAVKLLRLYYPELEVIVPFVNKKCRKEFEKIKQKIAPELILNLIDGKGREVMIACDAAILASGTATLECMLAKCPMVVAYKIDCFSFWLVKFFVKIRYFSLPNLLAGYELVKELFQKDCYPEAIVDAVLPLLDFGSDRDVLLKAFFELHMKIRWNANERAADAVLEIVNG